MNLLVVPSTLVSGADWISPNQKSVSIDICGVHCKGSPLLGLKQEIARKPWCGKGQQRDLVVLWLLRWNSLEVSRSQLSRFVGARIEGPREMSGSGLVAMECFAAMLFVSDFLQATG